MAADPRDPRQTETGRMEWSIVIPTRRLLTPDDPVLARLAPELEPKDEVLVVVDGGTPPTTFPAGSPVRWSRNPGQRGFGPTCNHGAASARGRLLLILNDDVQIAPGTLAALATALRMPGVGAVSPNVISRRLGHSESGTELFWHHGVLEARQGPLHGEGAIEVPYLCGAALALRRSDFLRLGGFDARLAPYFWEDADLSLRLRRQAGRLVVLADCKVDHAHGATIDREPRWRRRVIYERNRLLVTWRHLPRSRRGNHFLWLLIRFCAGLVRSPAVPAGFLTAFWVLMNARASKNTATN